MYICTEFVLDEGVEYQYGEPYSNINKERFIFETLEEAVKMNANMGYDIYEVEPTINRGFKVIKKIEEKEPSHIFFYYNDRNLFYNKGTILEVAKNGVWEFGEVFFRLYADPNICMDEEYYHKYKDTRHFEIYEVKALAKVYEGENCMLTTKIQIL